MARRNWQRYLQWRELRKFAHYAAGSAGFAGGPTDVSLDDELLATVAKIRGGQSAPALFIHGMMPRSGTVYVGQLLRHHPDLYAFPRHLFELPLLQLTADVRRLQEQFLVGHRHNRGKVADHTFLALLGAAFIAHLQAATPPGKRMLLKVPNVEYLPYFSIMFPFEHLLVLLRDGRDLADSTGRTWPMLPFPAVCRRWRLAANVVRRVEAAHQTQPTGYWQGRFEDAVADPDPFVRAACARFGLDADRYPFDAVADIRVRGSARLANDGEVTWEPQTKPRDFNPTGYWRDWSPLRKRIFKAIAGQALIDLDYAADKRW